MHWNAIMLGKSQRRYISDYLASVPEAKQSQLVAESLASRRDALQLHLTDPSIPAVDLAAATNQNIEEVRFMYLEVQCHESVQQVTSSPFYPRRMMTQFAEATVRDWTEDPEYSDKILRGHTVAARNLEVHATRGTCDYTCTMCLWSDKKERTYRNLRLDDFDLMATPDWGHVFQNAKELGTRRIVFSGGGEPLLRKDLFDLSATARNMGLKTQLYSNGFGLRRASEKDWDEIMHMEQVRFSVHSPTVETYNQIVAMPEDAKALLTVSANIKELLARRKSSGGNVRVGIGFVTQALNHHQIELMVDFAKDLGVDFINLRQDEVQITRELADAEKMLIAAQLASIRSRMLSKEFGNIQVDMSDDMVALANGVKQATRRVASCFVKLLRPAISPFGVVAPCDLRAEPRFSHPDYVLGHVKRQEFRSIIAKASQKNVDAGCAQCMPSGRVINAVVTKLIGDYAAGIHFSAQPFYRAR